MLHNLKAALYLGYQTILYYTQNIFVLKKDSTVSAGIKYARGNVGLRLVNWPKRMQVVGSFVNRCAGSEPVRVIDLGCGHQGIRRYLPNGSIYIPVDQHKRSEDTLVVDLNKTFPDGEYDISLLIGILEYLDQPLISLSAAMKQSRFVIFSYNGFTNEINRIENGWKNNIPFDAFYALIEQQGFVALDMVEIPRNQRVFLLARR
jgi:hypothetical protein